MSRSDQQPAKPIRAREVRSQVKSRASRSGESAIPVHDDCWRDTRWRSQVRRRLIDWFGDHARDLPWRRTPTPYRVWVSEIMLQQTQVATVIDYYRRFLQRFPNVESLAQADPQELLSLWEGLGYYRRARSMHAAARQIVAAHGGEFPASFDEVVALPGVGRYTAGAILSISRDVRLPILEGNTQRVFSRWIALRSPVTDRSANRLLWQVAEEMLPSRHVGRFNQAAMELGALVCVPSTPDCANCPVARNCSAHKQGLQDSIPGKVSRVDYQDRTEYAMVVRKTGAAGAVERFLLRVLPEGGRWAGLWDFPRTTEREYASPAAAAKGLSRDLGVRILPGDHLQTIRHAVTRYRIRLHVHAAELSEPIGVPPRPWRFLTLKQMASLPMSATGRQIAELLQSQSPQ